jgi:cytoskeletal protein CcmA (bactofilin family)
LAKAYDELKHAEQFRHVSSVATDLRIKGQISGNEDLVVDGIVNGPIQLAAGSLTVGEKGNVTGDIAAREVVIHGSVTGNLQVSDRVEIKTSGSLVGDVETARIIINDGAHFKGSIEIGAKKPPVTAPAPEF